MECGEIALGKLDESIHKGCTKTTVLSTVPKEWNINVVNNMIIYIFYRVWSSIVIVYEKLDCFVFSK